MLERSQKNTLPHKAPKLREKLVPALQSVQRLRRMVHVLLAGVALSVFSASKGDEPSKTGAAPVVAEKSGTLVIVGGGNSPEADAAFLELAGESAKIVLIPSASDRASSMPEVMRDVPLQDVAHFWKPPKNPLALDVLNTRRRTKADEEGFASVIRSAKGVYFSGGDQGWLSDALCATRVQTELEALLARGGVICGTSAGASVMSENMIRNDETVDGKVKPVLGQGFGFLDHVFFEHHFLRPRRRERIDGAREKFSDHSVLGLEDGMAVIVPVRKKIATVIGTSTVHYFPKHASGKKMSPLRAGDSVNLMTDDIQYARDAVSPVTTVGAP